MAGCPHFAVLVDNTAGRPYPVVHTLTRAWTTNLKSIRLRFSPSMPTYCNNYKKARCPQVPSGSRSQGQGVLQSKHYYRSDPRTLYIGATTDPEAQRKADAIQGEMQRAKGRRQTVGLLRRSGIPAPTTELGRVWKSSRQSIFSAKGRFSSARPRISAIHLW